MTDGTPLPLDTSAILATLRAAVARACPRRLKEEREDLVQASFLRLMEAMRSRGPEASVNATYVWKTAFAVTLDELSRARRRYESPADDDVDSRVDGRAADPESAALTGELGRAIRDCLSRLDAVRRRAAVLRLAGFGHPEAASLLGTSPKQTANLIFRGMEDLRECLRGKGITP